MFLGVWGGKEMSYPPQTDSKKMKGSEIENRKWDRRKERWQQRGGGGCVKGKTSAWKRLNSVGGEVGHTQTHTHLDQSGQQEILTLSCSSYPQPLNVNNAAPSNPSPAPHGEYGAGCGQGNHLEHETNLPDSIRELSWLNSLDFSPLRCHLQPTSTFHSFTNTDPFQHGQISQAWDWYWVTSQKY